MQAQNEHLEKISGTKVAIGQFIRDFRNSLGLTIPKMAKKLGIAPRTLGSYEQGAREPQYETWVKLVEMGLDATRAFSLKPFSSVESRHDLSNSENQLCRECEKKDAVIESLEKQLKESRKELIELGNKRPASPEPQEAQPPREREREHQTARGRR